MGKHQCGAIGCKQMIGVKFLMCLEHWNQVPKDMQNEVYSTYRARSQVVDATWAPWWRAQAKAIAEVFKWTNETAKGLWLKHQMLHADSFENRGKKNG